MPTIVEAALFRALDVGDRPSQQHRIVVSLHPGSNLVGRECPHDEPVPLRRLVQVLIEAPLFPRVEIAIATWVAGNVLSRHRIKADVVDGDDTPGACPPPLSWHWSIACPPRLVPRARKRRPARCRQRVVSAALLVRRPPAEASYGAMLLGAGPAEGQFPRTRYRRRIAVRRRSGCDRAVHQMHGRTYGGVASGWIGWGLRSGVPVGSLSISYPHCRRWSLYETTIVLQSHNGNGRRGTCRRCEMRLVGF